ncbi:unnamed protein product [Prunus armeniaca]
MVVGFYSYDYGMTHTVIREYSLFSNWVVTWVASQSSIFLSSSLVTFVVLGCVLLSLGWL